MAVAENVLFEDEQKSPINTGLKPLCLLGKTNGRNMGNSLFWIAAQVLKQFIFVYFAHNHSFLRGTS